MIKKCDKCSDYKSNAAKFQDEQYGKGNRVHNPGSKTKQGKVICTVCEDIKSK